MTISNTDKYIDSRDVIERIEELESEKESFQDAVTEAQDALDDAKMLLENAESETDNMEALQDAVTDAEQELKEAKQALQEWQDSDESEELKALQELQEEAEGYCSDWRYGATLIHEDAFTDYVEELARDIGAIGESADWIVINWEATAENVKVDYTSVDFDGETYYVR